MNRLIDKIDHFAEKVSQADPGLAITTIVFNAIYDKIDLARQLYYEFDELCAQDEFDAARKIYLNYQYGLNL